MGSYTVDPDHPNLVVNGVGDYWPRKGDVCERTAAYNFGLLDKAIGLCKNTRVVVQAGGNVGIFPRYLSDKFQQVYTFEPFPTNYECLLLNLKAENVSSFNAALGRENGSTHCYEASSGNCGDVRTGASGEECEVIQLDSLDLEHLDLLYLDTQGDEFYILHGAKKTLMKNRPVLVIEWAPKVWDGKFTAKQIEDLLDSMGYKLYYSGHLDRLYLPNESIHPAT